MITPDQPIIITNLTEDEAISVYHYFHRKFGWGGYHFDSSDIESAWEYQQEVYNDGLVTGGEAPIRDIALGDIDNMLKTRDWLKYLPDALGVEGNWVVQQMVEQYINEITKKEAQQ
jgi:hypothetical protein